MRKSASIAITFVALAVAVLASQDHVRSAGPGNSIAAPDTTGDTGWYTSLVLDASGNPVVSYGRADTEDLKVLHCGNPTCTAGNVIATPDTAGSVGLFTSLELDASGRPVVSYYRFDTGNLKVLHCGNANCTSGNVIASPDTAGDVGWFTSLELDANGSPVVSYYRFDTGDLKVLHCGNANCTSGNAISSPDTAGDTGFTSSLELDANGRPVVSYYRFDTGDLKLLHCGNANCTSGNSITTVDSTGDTGVASSLELDAGGNPVIAYYRTDTNDLKVVHCGNVNCTSGNTFASPDSAGDVGAWASLAIDASGNPVVSYWRFDTLDLKVLHCGNPNCTSGNTITAPQTNGEAGAFTSLALDEAGNPVVSYNQYGIARDLKLLHCSDPSCTGAKPPTPTPTRTSTPTNTPTRTPTVTDTPTVTPTSTMKNLAGDTDGDTVTNDIDPNDDNDGCTDAQEIGLNPVAGGLRDPHNFWDFYDVPTGAGLTRDGAVSGPDIFAVIGRFNTSGDAGIDPLSTPPASGYHTAYDRGPIVGANPWNLGSANGSVAGTDIFAVIGQFNHSCA